ncbi:MAG: PP2C family serine/threonine-protein phosphatase [Pyrinomonadaceae bacterium]
MEQPLQLRSASISDKGLSDKRPQNEDSFLDMVSKGIFAVADGVGGAQAGDVASQMAVEVLGEAFINRRDGSDPEDTLRTAVERANSAIHQMSLDLPQLSTMATTLVALHIDNNIATIGHVGDSRLYRLNAAGVLFRETSDHSVVEEEVRAGRLTPEQAENHPSKNVISRALGAESTVDIDLKTIMIEPNTVFLLCSDGITRHISDPEIAELLSNTSDPAAICHSLKETCFQRGAEDNLTAIIVQAAKDAEVYSQPIKSESEEVTVATARSPFVSTAAAFDVETADAEESIATAYPDPSGAPALAELVPDENVRLPARSDSAVHVNSEPILYSMEEPASNGLGRFFTSLGILFLGGVLGAVGYYFIAPMLVPPPAPESTAQIEVMSSAPPLPAFEEDRRSVDKDPASFLAANQAQPQDAEDYYLRGRAYLLTGKYWDAKLAFKESSDRLAQADPLNANVIATEIAMGLAIINNSPAQQAFERDLAVPSAKSGSNANVSVMPPIN